MLDNKLIELQLNVDNVLYLSQKPRVNFGECKHLIQTHTLGKGVSHVPDALWPGLAQFFF